LTLPQAPAGDFRFHRFIETICDGLDALLIDREIQETDFEYPQLFPLDRRGNILKSEVLFSSVMKV